MNSQEQQPPGKGPSGMDHPEQVKTNKESLFDQFKSEQHVDPIPMEDLNEEMKEEQDKEGTKRHSSSPKKFNTGFE
ncbi:hypothetical protein DCC85_06230 [Paenibacillus sp. CAA11]|uniref:hypothetical protein n=1 Tax=Paenibacillus sp. CAA11 TaxID=1532905 RepID=UPI000D3906B5|nr:hypothetical protein [Paenibacillus sp. CAA11]AWB43859.1 hypothetical protein DCC85_06230 [Paenibacillus sp. CAA11]